MGGTAFIQTILNHASVRGSRSTVMNPLAWLLSILFAGLVACLGLSPPGWIILILGVAVGVVIVIFIIMYIVFAIQSPDALRSEKFYLTKLAIEKSIKGDSIIGLIDPEVEASAELLASASVDPRVVEK